MNERTNEIPNSSSVTLELSIVAGGFWFSESCFRDFPRAGGREGGREEETAARSFAMQQAVD
jgi:hypothetical protein